MKKIVRAGAMVAAFCATSLVGKMTKAEEKSKNVHHATNNNHTDDKATELYESIDFGKNKLDAGVFQMAYNGYRNLQQAGHLHGRHILTVCDFSLSSNAKRMWVLDLDKKKVLFNSLVAHGQGSGEEFAKEFSNVENSHQSSLGFYVTDGTYMGENGYSLKLHGMDAGYNDAAYQRAIVMHGADYVSEVFIRGNQRLGRSWGCPAVPAALATPIINTIRNSTCLYIHAPNKRYLAKSVWINRVPRPSDDELIQNAYAEAMETTAETKPTETKPADTRDAETAGKKIAEAQPAKMVETFGGMQLATGRP
ncbi:MAG: murein L,D-transpeptidase catalytic domain family protein [Edaphocola sp.]